MSPAPQSGNPAPHRGAQVSCHPLRMAQGVPTWTMPQHKLWCRRGESPSEGAMLAALVCATSGSHFVPWPWPEETRKSSFPRTTFLQLRQPKQPASPQQFKVPALLPATGHPQRNPISLSSASHWSAIPVESTHQCGVHRQLSTSEERQAINDTPPIGDIRVAQVKVPYENVRRDSASRFATYAGNHILQTPPASLNTPACSVMAKSSSGRPHRPQRQERTVR